MITTLMWRTVWQEEQPTTDGRTKSALTSTNSTAHQVKLVLMSWNVLKLKETVVKNTIFKITKLVLRILASYDAKIRAP